MISWDQVKQLRDEVGAEDFEEVVQIFVEEVDEVVDRLRENGASSNLEADLHFLKGSALNLGFADFSELCATGESMAAAGQAAAVDLPGILDCYMTSRTLFLGELPQQLTA